MGSCMNYHAFMHGKANGGGPVTAATLGTPAIATNTSGGLTKLGVGTITLTASNTYSGATIISNGTLALTGTASFDNSQLISIQTGATLSVTGRVDGTLALGPARPLVGVGTVRGIVNNDGNVSPGIGGKAGVAAGVKADVARVGVDQARLVEAVAAHHAADGVGNQALAVFFAVRSG